MTKALNREKLYDLAASSPVILWLGIGVAGSSLRMLEMLGRRDDALMGEALMIGPQVANISFLLLAIALLIVRRPPVRKAEGWRAKFAGVLGCLVPFFVLALPQRELSPGITTFLSALGFLGITASIYVMFWLGRSFSILPQARGLVTEGPYRLVRHPLYLAEFLVMLSRVFELVQPWPLVMMAAAVGSQIARMHYEEQVLSEAFPAYREYARHTARLIPGLY